MCIRDRTVSVKDDLRQKGLKSLKRHAITRLLGMSVCTGLCIAVLYYQMNQSVWAWTLWGYSTFVHAPLWYFVCRQSPDILKSERVVMRFDFLIFGHFMAMSHFQPWVVFSLLMVTTINSLIGAGL